MSLISLQKGNAALEDIYTCFCVHKFIHLQIIMTLPVENNACWTPKEKTAGKCARSYQIAPIFHKNPGGPQPVLRTNSALVHIFCNSKAKSLLRPCVIKHVNIEAPPLMKMAFFKPKRHLFKRYHFQIYHHFQEVK